MRRDTLFPIGDYVRGEPIPQVTLRGRWNGEFRAPRKGECRLVRDMPAYFASRPRGSGRGGSS